MRFAHSTRVSAVLGLLLISGMSARTIAYAQGGASPPTGGRTLVSLNLAGTPLGTLPPEIDLQTGALDVVDRNGRRMLRASSASAFLVNLPQRLPRDFLLELELIPKITSTSEEFSLEGTREQDQGDQSTNLIWFSSSVRAVGGGSQFDAPMPPSMHGAVAGVPTQVAIWVQDRLIRVYTNGQLTQTIPNRRFVRNPFIRLFLGGQDDDQEAVYLASLRIADMGSSTATMTSALGGSNVPGQQPGGGSGAGPMGPNSSGSTSGAAPVPNAIANLTVTDTPAGPVVSWLGVPSAVFTVQRWLIANPPCCFNTSPVSPPLTASSWQDSPPPSSGTYIYRVTSQGSSGSTFAETQFTYGGAAGSVAPAGGTASAPAPAAALPAPTRGLPAGSSAPSFDPLLGVTVTMGPQGPVVTWRLAPNTTYLVQRSKSDDLNCCNGSSGTAYAVMTQWQDQQLPVSGTYVYRVLAQTPVGPTYGEAQFGYTAPGAGSASTAPAGMLTTSNVAQPGGTMVAPTAPAATSSTSGRYRVTLTGMRVSGVSLEMPVGPDGRGDEVYAAAAVTVWDRSTRTVRHRSSATTKEYGEVANALLFPNRIQGGTITPNGGIWTGNGVEQIPAQYDPTGSAIPAHTSDRFPMLVWEGVLTDGIEAVLVVPTLWERDVDASVYTTWSNAWSSSPLPQHLLSPNVIVQMGTTPLASVTLAGPAGPIMMPIPDMTANVRDHPIGVVPTPAAAPVAANYLDRHVMITREKLTGLQSVGASTILPITYNEPTTIFSRGSYTLYLRIERVQ